MYQWLEILDSCLSILFSMCLVSSGICYSKHAGIAVCITVNTFSIGTQKNSVEVEWDKIHWQIPYPQ